MQPVENPQRVSPVACELTADRLRPSATRSVPSRRAAASGGGSVTMAAVTRRHQQQMTSHRQAVTRKSLQRANRVNEHLSHCPRQRRYNYKLCYSDRQRRGAF